MKKLTVFSIQRYCANLNKTDSYLPTPKLSYLAPASPWPCSTQTQHLHQPDSREIKYPNKKCFYYRTLDN